MKSVQFKCKNISLVQELTVKQVWATYQCPSDYAVLTELPVVHMTKIWDTFNTSWWCCRC